MIDTDKYEGHYTGNYFARFWVTADDVLNADIERANATTILIYDSPFLLAEVKRLREAIADVAINMRYALGGEAADGEYMRGFIEDLKEMIE
jgi:hypothetical protein|tara:strand:- start:8978 stop:9253 length:276 start_codon:yes stop_codon:yes gene_type:complete